MCSVPSFDVLGFEKKPLMLTNTTELLAIFRKVNLEMDDNIANVYCTYKSNIDCQRTLYENDNVQRTMYDIDNVQRTMYDIDIIADISDHEVLGRRGRAHLLQPPSHRLVSAGPPGGQSQVIPRPPVSPQCTFVNHVQLLENVYQLNHSKIVIFIFWMT